MSRASCDAPGAQRDGAVHGSGALHQGAMASRRVWRTCKYGADRTSAEDALARRRNVAHRVVLEPRTGVPGCCVATRIHYCLAARASMARPRSVHIERWQIASAGAGVDIEDGDARCALDQLHRRRIAWIDFDRSEE